MNLNFKSLIAASAVAAVVCAAGSASAGNSIENGCAAAIGKNVTNGISGCYNLIPSAWAPGTSVNYQVAAFLPDGTIGPLSAIFTRSC